MNRVLFFFATLIGTLNLETMAQPRVKATFRVSYKAHADAPFQAFISGDFTNWEIHAMDYEGDDIYAYHTTLSAGQKGKYYYLEHDTWDAIEPFPGVECAYERDRWFEIGISDSTYLDVFGTCDHPETNYVMLSFIAAALSNDQRQLFIAGTMTDWKIVEMNPLGNGYFGWAKKVPESTAGSFYFLTADNWSAREPLPGSECANGKDRFYSVGTNDCSWSYYVGSCEEPPKADFMTRKNYKLMVNR